MGREVDEFVGELEHETDLRNLLDGKTYAERDIKTLIRGRSAPAATKLVTQQEREEEEEREQGKEKERELVEEHEHGEEQREIVEERKSLLQHPPLRQDTHETPLTSHWVKAPVDEAKAQAMAQAKAAQQLLRAMGGPEIVYSSARKEFRKRHPGESEMALRMGRARAMRSDAGASRALGEYFAGAHSAVSEHSPSLPFAKERVWTLGTEKADMNNYFDNLEAKTEKHVKEITNVHHAVEPSTKWQDGLESRDLVSGDEHLLADAWSKDARVALNTGPKAKAVLGQAAKVLTMARSDLQRWKSAQPGSLH